jgi:hypothetical protein
MGISGSFGFQDPHSVGQNATVSGGNSQAGSPLSASSIQKSELEAVALMLMANIPMLIPPINDGNNVNVDPSQITKIEMMVESKKHDIISKMWDSYIEQLHQIADRMKKDDEIRETVDAKKGGPKSATEYYTYLMALSATARADETGANGISVQFTNTFNQWLVNPVEGNTSSSITSTGSYPSAGFITGSVAGQADVLRTSIGADSAILGVWLSSSPVSDAMLAVGPTSGLPADYQAAAALVAALLNGGAVAKASADTVAAGGVGKPVYDLNFAVNYAQQVMAIVTKDIGKDEQLDPQRASQTQMIKLMLSAMALNMVYRAAYGGMHSKEFANILAGDIKGDVPADLRNLLTQLAGFVNNFLPTDQAARKTTIASLLEYVDSKDSVDSMLETSHLFASFLDADLDANRLASGKT